MLLAKAELVLHQLPWLCRTRCENETASGRQQTGSRLSANKQKQVHVAGFLQTRKQVHVAGFLQTRKQIHVAGFLQTSKKHIYISNVHTSNTVQYTYICYIGTCSDRLTVVNRIA